MLTRIYDSSLEITIVTHCSEYFQIFDSSWKLKDALAWMYDTYAIEDNNVTSQTCSYIKRYKLKSKTDSN